METTPATVRPMARTIASYPSCFGLSQALRLSDGSSATALEIYRGVAAGWRIAANTEDVYVGGTAPAYVENPFIAACLTTGEGYDVRLLDGRSLTLTGAHRLPLGEAADTVWCGAPDEKLAVRHQPIGRVDELRPGSAIMDGVVQAIRPLGQLPAVRLWTAQPAWLTTGDGVTVGSRWHETAMANGWWAWRGDRIAVTLPDMLPHLRVLEYSERAHQAPPLFEGACSWNDALSWAWSQTGPSNINDSDFDAAMYGTAADDAAVPKSARVVNHQVATAQWRQRAGRFNPLPLSGMAAIRQDASDGTARSLALAG